jgi:hypothetical protein
LEGAIQKLGADGNQRQQLETKKQLRKTVLKLRDLSYGYKFVLEQQGQYPVIYADFKDTEGVNFEEIFKGAR